MNCRMLSVAVMCLETPDTLYMYICMKQALRASGPGASK